MASNGVRGVRAPLTSDQLRRWLEEPSPPLVVDVRDPGEFARYHLPQARNLPLGELARRAGELDPSAEVVVVSEHGLRSRQAAEWLRAHGFARVRSLVGGMAEFRFPHG